MKKKRMNYFLNMLHSVGDVEKTVKTFGKNRVKYTYDGLVFRMRVQFDNGYTASVISGYGTYGNEETPYELAALYNDEFDYFNPITGGDVVGYLTIDEVITKCKQLSKLERREK